MIDGGATLKEISGVGYKGDIWRSDIYRTLSNT
jgi:hypothetical protein